MSHLNDPIKPNAVGDAGEKKQLAVHFFKKVVNSKIIQAFENSRQEPKKEKKKCSIVNLCPKGVT